ncbi:hypothetical protein JIG36_42010 [Actinoplanes sp. LDG1-06]|uniref:Lipoprotein n=1 Tax=Paractinoplanes ovalisporus TaxID=2810368 RepID=A0ABS2ASG4_9ACTN|nr:hypothetical protein [Actinoplanes ovalisporus]MBM2622099.1 hypothetical protein [Actinoplanes ovalisporus]
MAAGLTVAALAVGVAGCRSGDDDGRSVTAKVFVTLCAAESATCLKAAVSGVQVRVLAGDRSWGTAVTDEGGGVAIALPDGVSGPAGVEASSPVLSRALRADISVPPDGSVSVELIDPTPARR